MRAQKRSRPPGRGEPASVPGLPSRRIAARAVALALADEGGLDDTLAGADGAVDPLARAIALATFRRFGTIRSALAERMTKGLPTDPEVFALLATGAAQILFLDIPDHAAVDMAVRVAQANKRTLHLAGLANAVLRRVARDRDAILAAAPAEGDLPPWLAARWGARYGADRLRGLAIAHRDGAALDVTPRDDPAGWAETLGGSLLPTGSIRLADRRPVPDLPGFAEGGWWVQDAAAALPARLLRATAGERVLDLCAAPGGKTAQLAAAGATVTALDRSKPRLDRLRANLDRLGLRAEIVCADALTFRAEPFDAVLLDAPCSATGTMRRHPEVGWLKGEREIASLAAVQTSLLAHAADLVRPGGRLVFCVCSLEPEEGEDQVAAFLGRRRDFVRRPIEPGEAGIGSEFVDPAGDLRTVPDLWPDLPNTRPGLDGFYAARLERRAE